MRVMRGIKKGRALRTILMISCWGTTPWRTNRFRPNGGVNIPISANTTNTTPNHIELKPKFEMTGEMKGRVRTIIVKESKKHPKIKYMI